MPTTQVCFFSHLGVLKHLADIKGSTNSRVLQDKNSLRFLLEVPKQQSATWCSMFAFVMLWKSSPRALFFFVVIFFIKFICFVHATTKLLSTPPQSCCPLCHKAFCPLRHRAIFSTKLKRTLCLVSSCSLSVVREEWVPPLLCVARCYHIPPFAGASTVTTPKLGGRGPNTSSPNSKKGPTTVKKKTKKKKRSASIASQTILTTNESRQRGEYRTSSGLHKRRLHCVRPQKRTT